MATATFDTLKFANTLKAAGVPDKQAEAQATAFSEALQVNLKDLVTKDDLKVGLDGFRQEMRSQGELLRQEMKNQADALRAEMNAFRADTKNQFEALRLEIKNLADAIRHESKEADQRLRSEQVLVRWIVGVVLFSMVGLVIRFFAFRGVP